MPPARPEARLRPRLVLGVLEIDRLLAGLPFVLLEDEGAGAGVVLDLLVGVGLGDALGHHEGHDDGRLAERFEHRPELLLEHHLEGLGIDDLVVRSDCESFSPIESRTAQRFSEAMQSSAVTGVPSCHSSPSRSLKVQVSPSSLDTPGVDHLRLDLELLVHGEQRVVEHVAVIAHDVGAAPDRIEHLEIGMHDDLEGLRRGERRCGNGTPGPQRMQAGNDAWTVLQPPKDQTLGALAAACHRLSRAGPRLSAATGQARKGKTQEQPDDLDDQERIHAAIDVGHGAVRWNGALHVK